jgi:Ca2+-binding RTX toxin-like protein
MCSICDKETLTNNWANNFGVAGVHVGSPTGRYATALLPPDGIGDLQEPSGNVLLVITADAVGDGIGVAPGNPILTVGTFAAPVASTVSTLDLPGDQDYYQVVLEAGKTYQIGMYGKVAGPGGVPLADPYLEVRTADGTVAGNLIVTADGGASSLQNNVNSGLDVLLSFEPTVTGTYYINARAFGNAGGSTGDEVGDYEIFVNDVTNDPSAYRPYYDPESPLYSIDWGTQVNRVNQSVRNPDGNEGTRDTGNDQGVIPLTNPVLVEGKNVITIYFAKAGDVFTSIEDPSNPGAPPVLVSSGTKQWEKDLVFTALGEFEKVADVVYVEVDSRDKADFFFTTYAGTPGPGISLLGSMSPPDYPDEGLAQFNSGDYRWTESNLQQGGFSYVTLVHEFGHGHGLAHPHDGGGYSSEMRGVEGVINSPAGPIPEPTGVYPNYTLGEHNLNQGVFTMMSYQDGWQTSPYGNAATDAGYGYLGGLMAFDIAVIQDKYGVNEEWATGNDTYTLKDENAVGTFYSSIWDGGGTDQIVYDGTRDTVIDLRPATLKYEEGGGGRVSYAYGIYGGFTVANGVTIENARSGAGNDVLNGNDAANTLDSGAGNDRLDGGAGADQMFGGMGDDVYVIDNAADRANELFADGGIDTVESSITATLGGNIENLVLTGTGNTTGVGNGLANSLTGNDGNNVLNGAGGADTMAGGLGNDEYWIDDAGDTVTENANAGTDTVRASTSYTLGANLENLILSGTAAINGTGNDGNNALTGNSAANVLTGGLGNDTLTGAGGADTLAGGQGDDVYHIDSLDTLVEAAGEGLDTVHSAQSYTLQDNFEYLVLTGNLNVSGTGNALNNVLTGNAGNNQLNGGAGADNMFGGRGNDTYIVDNVGDRASEVYTDGGTDLVLSYVSYTLAANVENMNLVGSDAINGTGNGLANVINGNNANNVLTGGGGADTLNGGLGNDTYAYRSTSDSTAAAMDTIFIYKGDKIDLSVIDASTSASGNNAFAFVGAAAFSGTAGELRATGSGSSWTVEADVDGDGTADLTIAVTTNNIPLTSAEFVF